MPEDSVQDYIIPLASFTPTGAVLLGNILNNVREIRVKVTAVSPASGDSANVNIFLDNIRLE
jgi:hypothetical protein